MLLRQGVLGRFFFVVRETADAIFLERLRLVPTTLRNGASPHIFDRGGD